jgi:hypothetical protein
VVEVPDGGECAIEDEFGCVVATHDVEEKSGHGLRDLSQTVGKEKGFRPKITHVVWDGGETVAVFGRKSDPPPFRRRFLELNFGSNEAFADSFKEWDAFVGAKNDPILDRIEKFFLTDEYAFGLVGILSG